MTIRPRVEFSGVLLDGSARVSRLRLLGALAMLACALTAFSTQGTWAIFSQSDAIGGNAFSSGKIDLSTSPSTAIVAMAAMAPGDAVTAPVTVTNTGTGTLRYAVSSTTTENTLAAQLDLTVKSGVTTCTNAGFDASGSLLYGPADLGSTTGVNVIGDPAPGAQGGERQLNSGANEVLCVQVKLPTTALSSVMNLSTTATFTFTAEQTAHN